jgi:hypothetical protein
MNIRVAILADSVSRRLLARLLAGDAHVWLEEEEEEEEEEGYLAFLPCHSKHHYRSSSCQSAGKRSPAESQPRYSSYSKSRQIIPSWSDGDFSCRDTSLPPTVSLLFLFVRLWLRRDCRTGMNNMLQPGPGCHCVWLAENRTGRFK